MRTLLNYATYKANDDETEVFKWPQNPFKEMEKYEKKTRYLSVFKKNTYICIRPYTELFTE